MKYKHKEETHNLRSPEIIAPVLQKLFQPKSVIDVGCGIGTFLYAFKQLGIKEVLGLDGEWVNEGLLRKYLAPHEFIASNLSNVIHLHKKFDLAICLEVAEHIGENFSDNLVNTLVEASDTIVFSAATPYQQGQHHVNEQWPDYWRTKFLKYDFYFHDVLRAAFWNNPGVDFWYKQNLFLITHKDLKPDGALIHELNNGAFNNIIHPDAFIKRSKLLLKIMDGKMSTLFYCKLLLKKVLNKIGIYKKPKVYH